MAEQTEASRRRQEMAQNARKMRDDGLVRLEVALADDSLSNEARARIESRITEIRAMD